MWPLLTNLSARSLDMISFQTIFKWHIVDIIIVAFFFTRECKNRQYMSWQCQHHRHRSDNSPAPDWCFLFPARDVDPSEDLERTSDSLPPNLTLVSPQCVPENKVIQSELKLGELHDCIRRVREGPSSLPSISLYTVVNAHQGYVSM